MKLSLLVSLLQGDFHLVYAVILCCILVASIVVLVDMELLSSYQSNLTRLLFARAPLLPRTVPYTLGPLLLILYLSVVVDHRLFDRCYRIACKLTSKVVDSAVDLAREQTIASLPSRYNTTLTSPLSLIVVQSSTATSEG